MTNSTRGARPTAPILYVGDLMTIDPVVVTPDATIQEDSQFNDTFPYLLTPLPGAGGSTGG